MFRPAREGHRLNATPELTPERLCAALADPTRLQLLALLGDSEVCVCYLVEALAAPQPLVSRHLAYLRREGVVAASRDGKWMKYRSAVAPDSAAGRVLAAALDWARATPAVQAALARYATACCQPERFPSLANAPAPQPRAAAAPSPAAGCC